MLGLDAQGHGAHQNDRQITDIAYYGASKTRQLTDSLAVCSLYHKDRDVSPQGLPLQFFSVLAAFKQGFFNECPGKCYGQNFLSELISVPCETGTLEADLRETLLPAEVV